MRVVKKADVRKNEILDAAAALFAEKGFDHTSTGEILEAVGIARGTLYHHFKSKEDIMDALIERNTACLLEKAKEIAENTAIPVEERIIRTVAALHVEDAEGTEGGEMLAHLHKPQNALMHQKTQRIIMRSVPPILAGILEDGIAQGLFETPFPLECMELIFSYLDTKLEDDLAELPKEERSVKIRAFIFNLERLLGVKPGRLAFMGKMLGEEGGYER